MFAVHINKYQDGANNVESSKDEEEKDNEEEAELMDVWLFLPFPEIPDERGLLLGRCNLSQQGTILVLVHQACVYRFAPTVCLRIGPQEMPISDFFDFSFQAKQRFWSLEHAI